MGSKNGCALEFACILGLNIKCSVIIIIIIIIIIIVNEDVPTCGNWDPYAEFVRT